MERSERIWQAAVAVYPTLLSQAINVALKFPKDEQSAETIRTNLASSALIHANRLVAEFEKQEA